MTEMNTNLNILFPKNNFKWPPQRNILYLKILIQKVAETLCFKKQSISSDDYHLFSFNYKKNKNLLKIRLNIIFNAAIPLGKQH